jgi:hypothetical protein
LHAWEPFFADQHGFTTRLASRGQADLSGRDDRPGALKAALSDQTGSASERQRVTLLFQSSLVDIEGDGEKELLAVTGEVRRHSIIEHTRLAP